LRQSSVPSGSEWRPNGYHGIEIKCACLRVRRRARMPILITSQVPYSALGAANRRGRRAKATRLFESPASLPPRGLTSILECRRQVSLEDVIAQQ
jgi:hypothetical protein